MNNFDVRQGELVVGDLPISRLADRVGQTPFYAYDRGQIRHRVEQVRAALPPTMQLHYAIKANPMPALLSWMCTLVDGLDVASAGELALALDAGADPGSVSFAGPGKRETELTQAVASGVLVNLESTREVALLAQASQRLGLPAKVAVRVNPDFDVRRASMRMGGGARPFGIDAELVPALLQAIKLAGLQFEGFHIYPCSQVLDGQVLAQVIGQSCELLLRLGQAAGETVRLVNLGGGWGVPYAAGQPALNLEPISNALALAQEQMVRAWPGVHTVVELGRYLVAEAGVYVARILDRKLSRGEVFLVTDGGMHHHLAASGNFGQVVRRNYPVAIGNRMGAVEQETASVVGPLCTPLDILADRMTLAQAEPGDLVVVFQSGAYGATASPQGFLGHPACREVLV